MFDDRSEESHESDRRSPCKYGQDCYQKNPSHHQKYKHPPKKRKTGDTTSKKKLKINDYFKADPYKKAFGKNTVDSDTQSGGSSNRKVEDTYAEARRPDCEPKRDDGQRNKFDNMTCDKAVGKKVSDMNSNSQLDTVVGCSATSPDAKKDICDSDVEITEADRIALIKAKLLVEMPTDFYSFWEFCKTLNKQNPCNALAGVGLSLVGPYDVLAGKFDKHGSLSDEQYLLHWRYYRDPPEMQTVLKGDNSVGYHIGYFRDAPDKQPSFLVSNCAVKDGILHCVGDNIFAAVTTYLEELKSSGDPFKKMQISKYQSLVKRRADELGLSLSKKSDKVMERDKKAVAKTFNKVGLVVPYNKKTQLGYRNLTMGNKELRILLDKLEKANVDEKQKYLSELQPVLTYATIATDECDFGTGLELGWNLLCHGVDGLNSTIARFLTTSYKLLNRDAFARIIEAHMKNRKKGCNLSII